MTRALSREPDRSNGESSNVEAEERLPFLDGMRGFAVTYVILYHLFPKTTSVANASAPSFMWDAFWLMGWSGVDLFFVLSGFLITGILFEARSKPHYLQRFYLRRAFRIFPLYYLLLIACLVVVPAWTGKPEYNSLWYWLYLANFDTELDIPFHPILCVAWSLAIEEQYYLLYPVMVRRLTTDAWRNLLIGLVIASVCVRIVAHLSGAFSPRQMYHFTFAHFDGIAWGGLLRILLLERKRYERFLVGYRRALPVFLLAAAALALYCAEDALQHYRSTGVPGLVSFQPAMYLFGYLLNTLTYGSLLVWCMLVPGRVRGLFANRALRNLGKYSYAMYLLHFVAVALFGGAITGAVAQLMGSATYDYRSAPMVLVSGACFFLLTYGMARTSWVVVERPMYTLRDRIAAARFN